MVGMREQGFPIWSSLRSLVAIMAAAMLALVLGASPVSAADPLPWGKSWLPADLKPIMPRPFGISLVSMHVGETLDISDFAVTLQGQKLPAGVFSLPFVSHTTHITGINGDVWLLPFLNLHGTIGHVSGTAHDINPVVVPGLLPPTIAIPSSVDYSGTTYAAGTTLGIGYRYMFASYDFTYNWASIDLLDNTVTSTAQTVRAGVRTSLGKVRAAIYGGAYHENINGPLTGTGLIPQLNPEFSLRLTPRGPWNALVGANLQFMSRFVVTTEVGLGNRKQFLISPGVRF